LLFICQVISEVFFEEELITYLPGSSW